MRICCIPIRFTLHAQEKKIAAAVSPLTINHHQPPISPCTCSYAFEKMSNISQGSSCPAETLSALDFSLLVSVVIHRKRKKNESTAPTIPQHVQHIVWRLEAASCTRQLNRHYSWFGPKTDDYGQSQCALSISEQPQAVRIFSLGLRRGIYPVCQSASQLPGKTHI